MGCRRKRLSGNILFLFLNLPLGDFEFIMRTQSRSTANRKRSAPKRWVSLGSGGETINLNEKQLKKNEEFLENVLICRLGAELFA